MSIISLFATYVKYAITIFRYCIIWYNYIVGSILFIRIYKLLFDLSMIYLRIYMMIAPLLLPLRLKG